MHKFVQFVDPKTSQKLYYHPEKQILSSEEGSISYPIINGIPRFVAKNLYEGSKIGPAQGENQTALSFGNKWREDSLRKLGIENDFEKKQLREQFNALLGCSSDIELRNLIENAERTLNGGCGIAWSEYLFNFNSIAERHCVDLSLAVETAYENTKDMPNVTVSQASILDLPYPKEFFDIVYSNGVVHHTPDPKRSTLELGKRVKPDGLMGIYIYCKKPFLREICDKTIREKTTKLSYEQCYEFSRQMALLGKAFLNAANQPIEIEEDIPLLNIQTVSYDLQKFIYDHFIKCWYNSKMSLDFSNLVNLDWYHPVHASHHDKDEVFRWFEEAGFIELKCMQPSGWEHSGYFISGKKRK